MSTEVVMPQMGESIAEGTITKWLKKVGERVERDEPLFEISTDKVDAEIPSPAAGTLTEIRFKEGETVEVNTVVAVLDGGNGAYASTAAPAPAVKTETEQAGSPQQAQANK
ncbi:MAG: biotin/lipoyl-containing protein, partial [Pyrinomonadaceae bacterium]